MQQKRAKRREKKFHLCVGRLKPDLWLQICLRSTTNECVLIFKSLQIGLLLGKSNFKLRILVQDKSVFTFRDIKFSSLVLFFFFAFAIYTVSPQLSGWSSMGEHHHLIPWLTVYLYALGAWYCVSLCGHP